MTARWNKWGIDNESANSNLSVIWAAGSPFDACASSRSLCQYTASDKTHCFIEKTGLSCAGAPYAFGDYSVRAVICNGGNDECLCQDQPFFCASCRKKTDRSATFVVTARDLGCGPPRQDDCGAGDGSCKECFDVGGGGASGGGSPPGASPPFPGPRATLRYAAGGVGRLGTPGYDAWRERLGVGWSHEYAIRVIPDDPSAPTPEGDVWLATRFGTFRHYTNLEAGTGLVRYQNVSPSDEYRDLFYDTIAETWQLLELDGTIHHFDDAGRWVSTVDRFGNATIGCYDSTPSCDGPGPLIALTKPDGRSEAFSYDANGKLAAITEIGVGVTDCVLEPEGCRTWDYAWSGNELTRIDRPDGTALVFLYESAENPGFMTRMIEEGADSTQRLLTAWKHDSAGRVVALWRGDTVTGLDGPEPGPNAIDLWTFDFLAFDSEGRVTETEITDPKGIVTAHTYGRDAVSDKPRLESVLDGGTGCSICGFESGTSFTYDEDNPLGAGHPLRIWEATGPDGTVTAFQYDAHGQTTSRMEAVGIPALERTTTWAYHLDVPALVTSITEPSAEPGHSKVTTFTYSDSSGDGVDDFLVSRQIAGREAGASFTNTSVYTPNTAGQVASVDPEGFGTSDVTSFTYHPDRGDLLVASRTDPDPEVPGGAVTSYLYDAFNRRVAVTDANGLTVETQYDDLDRVRWVIQRAGFLGTDFALGDPPLPGDLATEHVYRPNGDLERTVLARGNVVAYGYDTAGRLESIERRPDATTSGERTRYALDAAGNRTIEHLERWDPTAGGGAGAWVEDSRTAWAYSTRCRPDSVTRGPPGGPQSTTEYEYDCQGRLQHVWDANHPNVTGTDWTQHYQYDDLDRLLSLTEPWDSDADGTWDATAVTSYGYDRQDHMTSVTDANGNATTYTYSDRDLLTKEVSPVSGETNHTYDGHGTLTTTTDARLVAVTYTPDELGRHRFADYPGTDLDVTWSYGGAAAANSIGRLTGVTRNGKTVGYAYDRFGRMTQDGDLGFSYDANGNRTGLVYPGGVAAVFGFDFADREESLDVTSPVGTTGVASGAAYLPSGPLSGLPLGNGLIETRSFDTRYQPVELALRTDPNPAVPELRRWLYAVDAVGNVLEIESTAPAVCTIDDLELTDQTVTTTESYKACNAIYAGPAFAVASPGDVTFTAGNSVVLRDGFSIGDGAVLVAGTDPTLINHSSLRSFTYRAPQYFLETAEGPWGSLAWSHDRIGNRLAETRNGGTDIYHYATNLSGGRLPRLSSVDLAVGGSRGYQYGAAGHVIQVTPGANQIDFAIDADGRLGQLDRLSGTDVAAFTYDGRSFLEVASQATGDGASVHPLYDSQGLVHALRTRATPSSPEEAVYYLYFAGRPVAQLAIAAGGAETWTWLMTDHLSAPLAATDAAGAVVWEGGFEPFGKDWQAGTMNGASESGLFLRLPGQWVDSAWEEGTMGAELFYNVHRWYESGTASYTKPDPLSLQADLETAQYRYALGNPIRYVDPLGLFSVDESCVCPNPIVTDDFVPLSSRIRLETKKFCQSDIQSIRSARLRRCLQRSCSIGRIRCEDCSDPAWQGYISLPCGAAPVWWTG